MERHQLETNPEKCLSTPNQNLQSQRRGDTKQVHRLQKLLMKSRSAKLLSVRKVTQENSGKATAGVDGIKSLNPAQRFELVNSLELTGKSKPTRRVMIPKPGTSEKRPLGIPCIIDRAKQMLVKLALEAEWEAVFEPNTYGFKLDGALMMQLKQFS